ncbi:MAG: nitrogen regulation protein NR(I) [Gammaproteobacteria bacterium]|nr:nitrogen regulation protein NR(I) [Gammaproteobacteria bacterium]
MNKQNEVWIVDDDRAIRWVLERALEREQIATRSFDTADKVLARLENFEPDVIITDIRMPGTDGLALLRQVQDEHPRLPVIIMTAYADLDRAVAAFRGGAFEYLPKPFDVDDVVTIVRRALRKAHESPAAGEAGDGAEEATEVPEIIGSSPAMQEVFRAIGRLANSNMTVLITGESGSGKELVARALHRHSPRAGQPLIALNTAAIPRDLLESELFGHEKGAFTGAAAQRIGRFEQANHGTLFLDEIGDMPAELQTRLLRVLADGEFYRVGGHEPVRVDVRVIAATHQYLEERVREGSFREDLFHRLNVIRLELPPLRSRPDDIEALAEHFLRTTAQELGVEPKRLTPRAAAAMRAFAWPGNVRQLENVCRRVMIMAPSREIDVDDLPAELLSAETGSEVPNQEDWEGALRRWAERRLRQSQDPILDEALPRFETTMIHVALNSTRGRRQEAAKLLGWGRNTLTRKIKELNLDV